MAYGGLIAVYSATPGWVYGPVLGVAGLVVIKSGVAF